MKASGIFLALGIFSLAIPYASGTNSTLIIIENATSLNSSEFGYPSNEETLDVIWLFKHSINLKIENFHLNGHDGDFILISEQPLLNAETFKTRNGSKDGSHVGQLAASVVTDQGILLSWKVQKKIEAVNEDGTFVLFHAEGKGPDSPTQFEGFEIKVVNYDESINTSTSTTPDPLIPPQPDQDLYISKFLSCMEPMKFLANRTHFKEEIARIATEYCNETGILLEQGPITDGEVNIPGSSEKDRAGFHYCATNWPIYDTCVEVTFAITRLNTSGFYILPADRLEEIWSKKSEQLRQFGYCPYTPPPEPQDLSALGWVIFLLAVILSLTGLLGVAWLKNAKNLLDYKLSFTKDFLGTKSKMNEVIDEKPQSKHYDTDNPIFSFFPSGSKRAYNSPKEDLGPSLDYLEPPRRQEDVEVDEEDADTPLGFKRSSFTNNPTFEEVSADVYAYANDGFKDDNDDENASGGPGPSRLNTPAGVDSSASASGTDKLLISRPNRGSGTSDIDI